MCTIILRSVCASGRGKVLLETRNMSSKESVQALLMAIVFSLSQLIQGKSSIYITLSYIHWCPCPVSHNPSYNMINLNDSFLAIFMNELNQ